MQQRSGLVAVGVLVAGLIGTYLWMSMLAGPLRLASGLLDARTHLNRAESALTRGAMKAARYETLSAAAAARRARTGHSSAGPLMDLARALPRIGKAVDEVEHLVRAAELSASAARGTLSIAETALRGKDKIIEADPNDPKGSARIRLERIDEIAATVAGIRSTINRVGEELEAIDRDAFPRRIQRSIADGIERARKTDATLAKAEAGFEILPGILGADEPRVYLIAMQNSAEQRGAGGAALQATQLEIDDGAPRLPKGRASFSVYEIDEDRRTFDIPLPPDAWYQREIPDARRFGNANWSPHWPLSAQLMLDYARVAEPRLPQVHGVIAVDPLMLQNLMPGVGRFTTHHGNVISTRKSVHFLLNRAYGAFGAKKEVRRAVLRTVVDRFFEGMIKPRRPTELVQGMADSLATKHMQIWLSDPAEQAFIERMDWDGGLAEAKGSDYLNVVEQNVGGNKLDFFQEQTHVLDVTVDGDDARNEVEVRVTNATFLPQSRYVLGDSGGRAQITRPMMNVYVPVDAQLERADVDGTRVALASGAASWSGSVPPQRFEAGKQVWPAALEIPFGDTQSVTYAYRVPGVVHSAGNRRVYRLVVQHQPKVRPERLVVRLHLPDGATAVSAPGWRRQNGVLVLERKQIRDLDLEVSWHQ